MSGTVTDLGDVSLGQALPTTLSAMGAVTAQLNADLVAAGSLKVALDLGLPSLAEATAIGAAANAQAIAMVTEPWFGLQVDANPGLIALIQAQLAALGSIIAALGQNGIELALYNGTASSFGPSVDASFGGGVGGGLPGDHIDALMLIAKTPEAYAAIQLVMKTS